METLKNAASAVWNCLRTVVLAVGAFVWDGAGLLWEYRLEATMFTLAMLGVTLVFASVVAGLAAAIAGVSVLFGFAFWATFWNTMVLLGCIAFTYAIGYGILLFIGALVPSKNV